MSTLNTCIYLFHTKMSKNKVAIVTGANKGLGFFIIKSFCKEYDGKVYLTSRDEKRGAKACEELNKLGLNPEFHQLDVTDEVSIENFLRHIRNRGEEIDILVNNAGILFLKDATESKEYRAEQTVSLNFASLVNFTEAALPLVKDGGRIVNISSSSGHLSRIPSKSLREKFSSDLTLQELKGLMNSYVEAVKRDEEISEGWGDSEYVVSKVGVNAYTFMLHRRLNSRAITVNCVHPGYVISDMTRGVGNVTPEAAAQHPARLALRPTSGGQYVWHNGATVPWDGPDPRLYIDGKN